MEFVLYKCLACGCVSELLVGYDGECPECGHDHLEITEDFENEN